MQITKTLNLNKVIEESSCLRRTNFYQKIPFNGLEVISYQEDFIILLQNAMNKSKQIWVKHGQKLLRCSEAIEQARKLQATQVEGCNPKL